MKNDSGTLHAVERPGRYVGQEVNATHKDPKEVKGRIALAYPDMYELGMSYLGLQVLYRLVNDQADLWAERVFAPAQDRERQLRDSNQVLRSLESQTALADFDLVGFTLQHELTYLDVLAMLDLAGIPLEAEQRSDQQPIIIAGGPCAANPEPLAPALDAVYLGDAEESLVELVRRVGQARRAGHARQTILDSLMDLPGVYIPGRYKFSYKGDGTIERITPLDHAPQKIKRALLPDLGDCPPPQRPVVPAIQAVHDRLAIEIQRGCTRGCRFCQAGMINRPLRQREQKTILEAVSTGLCATGHDQVSFLSLSSGDHPQILSILEEFYRRHQKRFISASLPSLRAESLTEDLAQLVRTVRKSGFTIAPEAGSERMRQVINKDLTEQDVLNAAGGAFGASWRLLKLYFMVGLPSETEEDRAAIVDLCRKVRAHLVAAGHKPKINVGISTFVPKAHTPFQWEPMVDQDQTAAIDGKLRSQLRQVKGVQASWTQPGLSWAEGLLSRADRRVFPALVDLVEKGHRLAGWREHFRLEAWQEAFAALDLPGGPDFLLRERAEDEILPWSHLDMGPSSEFLASERERALEQEFTPDCAHDACYDCGACAEGQAPVLAPGKPQKLRTPAATEAEGAQQIDQTERGHRVRLHLHKLTSAVHMSHIEYMTAVFRAVRRAAWPLLHTSGFHPKPKASFGPACPLGAQSKAEFIELTLTSPVAAEELERSLSQQLPPGLKLVKVSLLAEGVPGLNKNLSAMRYSLTLDPTSDLDAARAACSELLARPSWQVVRTVKKKRKRVDLRPSLISLEVVPDGSGDEGPRVVVELSFAAPPLARPSEVALEIFGSPALGIIREELIFRQSPVEEDGKGEP